MEDSDLRQIFRGYYRPTEEEFSELWKNCIFIPDANILLNIYRYSPATCDALINIFKEISERLWITHQAALEYHHQRLNVIGQQESAYENIRGKLRDLQKNNEKELNSFSRHPFINVKNFSEKIKGTLTEIENELDECKKKHPNLLDVDELRDNITTLFEGKVGTSYSPEKLKELYDIGKKRYERKIPPGFLDNGKDEENQFGDLILWFQIIDHAKSIKKPIIFITDDRKEDWWLKFKGKTIGPRPELIDEIYKEANVDFYMYQTEQFMTFAEKFIEREVDKEAIKEVQEIKQFDDEYRDKQNIRLHQMRLEKLRYFTKMKEKYEQLRDYEEIKEDLMDLKENLRSYEEIKDNWRYFGELKEEYENLRDFKTFLDFEEINENLRYFPEMKEKLKQVKTKQEFEKNQDESDEKPDPEND